MEDQKLSKDNSALNLLSCIKPILCLIPLYINIMYILHVFIYIITQYNVVLCLGFVSTADYF